MSASFGQTALLIFSRNASQESVAKTFDRKVGKKGNQAIAQRLIRETIATANGTHLPVFLHSTTAQNANTFGENLADALESVFNKGYTQVIAIGNDCPDLSKSLILEADLRLQEQKLVLGPANDGGVYLIGIQKSAYQRSAFLALPWETVHLQSGWKQYLATGDLEINWLQPYSDIDHAADFKALLNRLPKWSLLKKQFLSILASLHIALVFEHRNFPSVAIQSSPPLRGPPSC